MFTKKSIEQIIEEQYEYSRSQATDFEMNVNDEQGYDANSNGTGIDLGKQRQVTMEEDHQRKRLKSSILISTSKTEQNSFLVKQTDDEDEENEFQNMSGRSGLGKIFRMYDVKNQHFYAERLKQLKLLIIPTLPLIFCSVSFQYMIKNLFIQNKLFDDSQEVEALASFLIDIFAISPFIFVTYAFYLLPARNEMKATKLNKEKDIMFNPSVFQTENTNMTQTDPSNKFHNIFVPDDKDSDANSMGSFNNTMYVNKIKNKTKKKNTVYDQLTGLKLENSYEGQEQDVDGYTLSLDTNGQYLQSRKNTNSSGVNKNELYNKLLEKNR